MWLIPARAGKTSRPSRRRSRFWAHPRACGENRFDTDPLLADSGSSPRVRGKLDDATPMLDGSEAHPRACGENGGETGEDLTTDGSSPRVRGKPHDHLDRGRHDRLIPARAGKTCPTTSDSTRASAHPRACGENVQGFPAAPMNPGSSPRVRGKPRAVRRRRPGRGLIPARAGKT